MVSISMQQVVRWLACSRRRLLLVFAVNSLLFAFSGIAAYLLRFDFIIPPAQLITLLFALPVWMVLKPPVLCAFGLHRETLRFVSWPAAERLVWANAAASFVAAVVILAFGPAGFPRSIYFLDYALSVVITAAVPMLMLLAAERASQSPASTMRGTFIYGAGNAGVILLREFHSNPKMGYRVRGFIDDDSAKRGMLVQGIPVLGGGEALAELSRMHDVQEIVIAIPSATGQQMAKLLGHCAQANLRFRTMPSISEILAGSRVTLRDVALEDLLGRTPVKLSEHDLRSMLADKVVMVTGAAGSIGSELCRQIARFGPRKIVGFDIAETGMFEIDREIRRNYPNISFELAIGSIQHLRRLAEVFDRHRPAIVYHAAAYKHVPVMESHLFEAVENNVIGTYNLASLAGRFGVRAFVMISSDKAVRPTSIMGLTKRVAEIVVSSLQNGDTRYVSVRFGNVLGSSGSVVPIFKEQIARGGPVTVTHPDMRRYFMTIPEASQLVLESSMMGRGGEIFVLDMGEPVKIVDLARNLILLSGYHPVTDIAIEFTGIRPGEKLWEEVSATDEETLPTFHDKIRIFAQNGVHVHDLPSWIREIRRMCVARDPRLLLEFRELVSEYNPSTQVMRQVIATSTRAFRKPSGGETEALSAKAAVGAT
jgi:FlaA1/EpsC-like NDP-sugar epimerase